jgi:hypothetical protein
MTQTDTPELIAESWPIDPAETAEVLAAAALVAALIAAEHLPPIRDLDIHASNTGSKRWNPDTRAWDRPCVPEVTIHMPGARSLAAWARTVGVTRVAVKRRPGCDTCMNATADYDGVTWRLWGSYGLVLGSADDVTWAVDRRGRRADDGWMTVDALAALPERDRPAPVIRPA